MKATSVIISKKKQIADNVSLFDGVCVPRCVKHNDHKSPFSGSEAVCTCSEIMEHET